MKQKIIDKLENFEKRYSFLIYSVFSFFIIVGTGIDALITYVIYKTNTQWFFSMEENREIVNWVQSGNTFWSSGEIWINFLIVLSMIFAVTITYFWFNKLKDYQKYKKLNSKKSKIIRYIIVYLLLIQFIFYMYISVENAIGHILGGFSWLS